MLNFLTCYYRVDHVHHTSPVRGELDLPGELRLYCQEWSLQILVKICNAALRENEHSHPNTGEKEE